MAKAVGESGFEVVKNPSTPLVIFGSRGETFGNRWKSSEIFGDLRPDFRTLGVGRYARCLNFETTPTIFSAILILGSRLVVFLASQL